MDLAPFAAYLPLDRRHALAAGRALPDRAAGAALFVDISGFTPLTAALAADLGPQRGCEELVGLLNRVYGALIAAIHRYGGAVVNFSGDALTTWFDGDSALRAAASALAMQQAMGEFADLEMAGRPVRVLLKAGLAHGPIRRFLVGDPLHGRLDVLAGATLDRAVQAEQLAAPGEVVVAPEAAALLGGGLVVREWRQGRAVAAGLAAAAPPAPWPALDLAALSPESLRPLLLPAVYERLAAGQGEYIAELRPAVALFLRFGGLDCDSDDAAGGKLDAYVAWVQRVLARCGGHLLELVTGDKGSYLYASFGALSAHEDDAERAVAAAAELLRPPPSLAFITAVQIGISQGRVRAGAYGSPARRNYGVLGDEVNVAARLMESAPPGEMRLSERVARACRRLWTLEALPDLPIKGKAAPLHPYRPLARAERPAGPSGRALAGRKAELALFAQHLAALRAGERRILFLEGEAGIGKSRLLEEFAGMAGAQGCRWLAGVAPSIEQHTPYRAWRDVLAGLLGLEEYAPVDALRCRAAGWLRKTVPALELQYPLLNDVLPLDIAETPATRSLDPPARRDSLTALVVDMLRAVTAAGPLVLALEDAHWLDSLSWDLALAVSRALAGQPLLLVLALRPLEAPPAALDGLRCLPGCAAMPLAGLPPDEVAALAAARLGIAPAALPPDVAALVQERAAGNPFFAEEMALALRDSGALTVEGEGCAVHGDLAALRESVPRTVEGVVLARIDCLPPERQLTLKVAAVIGHAFLYRTLRDIHPGRVLDDLLRPQLDEMTRRGLTLREALEPELSYLFKHVITQQVAYETLLFAQRRELHRAVAGWYEQVYAPDLAPYYALLAHHWRGAEEAAREHFYCRLAGEQAAARYANAEAIAFLGRALELAPADDLAGRYALHDAREAVYHRLGRREEQAGDLAVLDRLAAALHDDRRKAAVALRRLAYAYHMDDYPAATAAGEEGLRLARLCGDTAAEAQAYRGLGIASVQKSRAAARAHLERALELAEVSGDTPCRVACLRSLGHDILRSGEDAAAACVYLEEALEIARAAGDRLVEIQSLLSLGFAAYEEAFVRGGGGFARARSYLEQARRGAGEIGFRMGQVDACFYLGHLARDDGGDFALARDSYEQALRLAREVGARSRESRALLALADLFCHNQGDYLPARAHYEQARAAAELIGLGEVAAAGRAGLGIAALALGQYAEAVEHLEAACRMGERWVEAQALDALCQAYHELGDDGAAAACGQRALQVAREVDDRLRQGLCLAGLGRALAGQGRLDEAGASFRQAAALFQEMGNRASAAAATAGLAEVALAQGDGEQARALVAEVVAYLRDNPQDQAGDRTALYGPCCRVLRAAGDPRADDLLAAAYRWLQKKAAAIADESMRRSFLENVPTHREVLRLHGPPPSC